MNIDWTIYVRNSHSSHTEHYLWYVNNHRQRTPYNYERLEIEHTNITEAMERLLLGKQWQSVCELAQIICLPQTGYLAIRGYWEALRVYLEQAIQAAQKCEREDVVASFRFNLSLLEHQLDNKQRAINLLLEVLSSAEALNDFELIGMILHEMGILAQELGDYESAHRFYHRSMRVREENKFHSSMYVTLFQLGTLAHFQQNFREAYRLYQESLEGFKKHQNTRGVAVACMQLGNLHMEQGNLPEAAECYQESLNIYQEIQSYEGLARVWLNQGILAKVQGNYAEARGLIAKSKERFERLGVELGKSSVYRELGDLSEIDENMKDAELWYYRSLATVTTRMDFLDISQRMGDLAFSVDDYCRAKRLYLRCVSLAETIGDNLTIAHAITRLSFIEQQMKQYGKARQYYDRCVDISLDQHRNKRQVAATINVLGQVACEFKDYKAAESFFHQSLEICQKLDFREGITDSLTDLADLSIRRGNMAEAEKLYLRLIEKEEQLGLVEDMIVDMFNLAMAYEKFGRFDESEKWLNRVIELESRFGSPDISRDQRILKRIRLQKSPGIIGWVLRQSIGIGLKAIQMLSTGLDYTHAVLMRMECWADRKANEQLLKV